MMDHLWPLVNVRDRQDIWLQGREVCQVISHGCIAQFCGRFSFDELATVGMLCNNNDDFLL